MKKTLFLMFFLSSCMSAPQSAFQINPDMDACLLNVGKIETISMMSHFDVLPHIENRLPISPEQAIIEWTKTHLRPSNTSQDMWIVVHKAEIIQTDLPDPHFFKLDEVNYTLNYEIEIQLRNQNQLIKKFPVSGTGFITMAKKASLSQKEKGWAWLIQKMLTHLKTKIQTDLKDVLISQN